MLLLFYEGLLVVVLEVLFCGIDVIIIDIFGVKEWIGSEINNFGKIEYVFLFFMEKEGILKDEELYDFENNLYNVIDFKI